MAQVALGQEKGGALGGKTESLELAVGVATSSSPHSGLWSQGLSLLALPGAP